MTTTLQELQNLRGQAVELERRRAEVVAKRDLLERQKADAMAALKELGCETVEEAEDKIRKLDTQLEKLTAAIRTSLAEALK
jgi:chaperonin cofactor prefoldin